MTKARKNLEIGFEFEPRTYEITQEKINIYSRYVFHGKDTKNIHTDDEIARKAGLPRAVAQGRYPIGYLSEVLLDFFGKGWVQGGKLEVSLIKGIYPGDTIAIKGKVRDKIQEGDTIRIILDVWIENQMGEKATVGTASGLVEDGEGKKVYGGDAS
jgi:acyl dehydratase